MDKPTMLDALEIGPEIEMMMLEWDSFAKNNLVSDDSIFYTSYAANKIEPWWSRESVFTVLAVFWRTTFSVVAILC